MRLRSLLLVVLVALLVPFAASGGASRAYRMRVLVTSYCLRGHTASGTSVHWGAIAVDPGLIRMGVRIYVPHYGYGRAEDTGSAIVGHHIDTWMSSCSAALRSTRYETNTVYG